MVENNDEYKFQIIRDNRKCESSCISKRIQNYIEMEGLTLVTNNGNLNMDLRCSIRLIAWTPNGTDKIAVVNARLE